MAGPFYYVGGPDDGTQCQESGIPNTAGDEVLGDPHLIERPEGAVWQVGIYIRDGKDKFHFSGRYKEEPARRAAKESTERIEAEIKAGVKQLTRTDSNQEIFVPAHQVHKTPGVCGGRACVPGTRIPVWILEVFRRRSEVDQISVAYPQLSEAKIAAALAYARQHPEEMSRDIEENDE